MSTNVSNVVSHFPDVENGFTTTLASTVSSGATTVPLNSVAGYTNGLPAVFVVDPTDVTKKQTFTGIVDTSGVQLTSVVWTAGTNQTHSGGATVVDYATATHIAMMSKGILVHADQDGTLKAGAVDNTAAIADGILTNAKLSTTAGELGGARQSWTPTFTNLSGGTLTYAKYTQVGKTVFYGLSYVLAGAGVAGSVSFTLPVAPSTSNNSAGTVLGHGIGQATSGGAFKHLQVIFNNIPVTSTVTIFAMNITSTYLTAANLSSTVPVTWANTGTIAVSGNYEAA